MKTCFSTIKAGFKIELRQYAPDRFEVQYGQELHSFLPYAAAAQQLGGALMHALALEGRLDNSEARK